MVKINGKDYILEDYGVGWGNFFKETDAGRKEGIAPRFKFYIRDGEEEAEILLELSYKVEEFKAMKNNEEVDLKSEVTDIIYWNDDWIGLIDCPFDCRLTRIDDDNFLLKFRCDDDFEEVHIEIEEILCMAKR